MVRVKEDYFKGGESFFKSPELNELLEDMDANGVEKAILMTTASAPREDRAVRFAEAAPDRFALAVGGSHQLRQMQPVRSTAPFVHAHPGASAAFGPSSRG